ncbi:MAG: hypothetical protein J7K57_01705 [Palaeococcus sp.]|uniref:hypothetical protein n=1 Tax=Palaeococcus sp. (in: euryarchaeotes) TaxID=2820298 RepID=UPI0025DCB0EB|nr:hypothetical protein [Palaeococcus sp. (in: euryarchaeotes)]MCD6558583.1 hypothetical protein [Palaeococcus sp. (in: euryarchaeotes)]
MRIVELDIKLPYEKRGKILSKLCEKVRGKIKDIHFLPPTATGISEIKMEIEVENAQNLVGELRRLLKEGRITFKVLTEA